MEQNHLCNFGRGHYEEHFCELFWISASGSGDYPDDNFVQWGETIYAILVKYIWGTLLWNYYKFGLAVQMFKKIVYAWQMKTDYNSSGEFKRIQFLLMDSSSRFGRKDNSDTSNNWLSSRYSSLTHLIQLNCFTSLRQLFDNSTFSTNGSNSWWHIVVNFTFSRDKTLVLKSYFSK